MVDKITYDSLVCSMYVCVHNGIEVSGRGSCVCIKMLYSKLYIISISLSL